MCALQAPTRGVFLLSSRCPHPGVRLVHPCDTGTHTHRKGGLLRGRLASHGLSCWPGVIVRLLATPLEGPLNSGPVHSEKCPPTSRGGQEMQKDGCLGQAVGPRSGQSLLQNYWCPSPRRGVGQGNNGAGSQSCLCPDTTEQRTSPELCSSADGQFILQRVYPSVPGLHGRPERGKNENRAPYPTCPQSLGSWGYWYGPGLDGRLRGINGQAYFKWK